MSGRKIIEGLEAAVRGDFSRVTIAGQAWVRDDVAAAGRKALEKIAAMDPDGVRCDDLGRAARTATEALVYTSLAPTEHRGTEAGRTSKKVVPPPSDWIDQNHQIDRYGVALMMIREGCADPSGLARRILSEFDSRDNGTSGN